jgi:hypothetical protein
MQHNLARVLGFLALVVWMGVNTVSSQSGPAVTKNRRPTGRADPTAPAARDAAAGTVQPRLVALPVVKCLECKATVRRRVAVMPVKIGVLSSELQASSDVVAAKVRDRIEQVIANEPGIFAVSRAEIGDVIAEQQLGTSGAFNHELVAPAGRLIPAQLLLVATVDRFDVTTSSVKKSNNTGERYIMQAAQKEQEAARVQQEAREAAAAPVLAGSSQDGIREALLNACPAYNAARKAYCDEQRRQWEQQKQERQQAAEREHQDRVSQLRLQAESLLVEASNLRQQASLEAQKQVDETRTKQARLVLGWKAVDVTTGAVVASGSQGASDSAIERGTSVSTQFRASESIESQRHDVLVNKLIENVVEQMSREVESKIDNVRFRAKVVKVDTIGVTLNAGRNLGLSVGDTFGVRRKQDVVTDPDTGQILEPPGPPVGILRVSEVYQNTALAQVIKSAGALSRGDELEWIGTYVVAEQAGSAKDPSH